MVLLLKYDPAARCDLRRITSPSFGIHLTACLLPTCWPACRPACLLTYLPASWLPVCLIVRQSIKLQDDVPRVQPTPQSIDYEVAPQSNLLQYVDHAGYKTELGAEVEVCIILQQHPPIHPAWLSWLLQVLRSRLISGTNYPTTGSSWRYSTAVPSTSTKWLVLLVAVLILL